jgi:hypothetical protein
VFWWSSDLYDSRLASLVGGAYLTALAPGNAELWL